MNLLVNLKNRTKEALRIEVPGRFSKISKNDVFLVSYPKSGNTWMRFLIGNLISSGKVDFNNINQIIPDIYQTTKQELDKYDSPRIIKSHEKYQAQYPKVIYIYRDPRDVVISYYFWKKKYKKDFELNMNDHIKNFIEDKSSLFGSWENHLNSWRNSPLTRSNDILFLKYEDIKRNEIQEMKKVCSFLNISAGGDEIWTAIENSDFKKMQKMETEQSKTSSYLKNSDKKIKFVRSGKSEWNKYLKGELKDAFKLKFGQILIDLGYEQDMNW